MSFSATSLEQRMAQAQAGDEAAYASLLREITPRLRHFIARQLGPADREDILQAILLSLHRARHTYDPARPFLPWVLAIARYRLKDHWRGLYRMDASPMADIADYGEFLGMDPALFSRARAELQRSLAALPPRQQHIIRQFYGQGQSMREALEAVKAAFSAIKAAARRACQRLCGRPGE